MWEKLGEIGSVWEKLGVCGAQPRSSTRIIKSLIVILLTLKAITQPPAARLTTIKNYVIIYIMKSMTLRQPALSLSIVENFLSQLKCLQPQFI